MHCTCLWHTWHTRDAFIWPTGLQFLRKFLRKAQIWNAWITSTNKLYTRSIRPIGFHVAGTIDCAVSNMMEKTCTGESPSQNTVIRAGKGSNKIPWRDNGVQLSAAGKSVAGIAPDRIWPRTGKSFPCLPQSDWHSLMCVECLGSEVVRSRLKDTLEPLRGALKMW